MSNANLYNELAEVLSVDPADITPQTSLTNAKWTSLSSMLLISVIDEDYGVTVDWSSVKECATVGDLLKLVGANEA